MLFPASMERSIPSSTKYNITGGIDSLKTDMTSVKADLDVLKAKGVVKSVQRGCIASGSVGSGGENIIEINVAPIDPTRSLFAAQYNILGAQTKILGVQVQADKVSVKFNTNSTVEKNIVWELIEYY